MTGDRLPSPRWQILKREWLLNGAPIVGLALWAVFLGLTPGFGSPFEQLLISVVVAVLAGFRFGSSDSLEGAEEFAQCLPATHSCHFFARYFLGLALSMLFVDVLWLLSHTNAAHFYHYYVIPEGERSVWTSSIARLCTVFGAFSCTFALTKTLPGRYALVGIPGGIMLFFVSGLIGVLIKCWSEPSILTSHPRPEHYIMEWSLACVVGGVLAVATIFVEPLVRGGRVIRDLRPFLGLIGASCWLGLLVFGQTNNYTGFGYYFPGGEVWEEEGLKTIAIVGGMTCILAWVLAKFARRVAKPVQAQSNPSARSHVRGASSGIGRSSIWRNIIWREWRNNRGGLSGISILWAFYFLAVPAGASGLEAVILGTVLGLILATRLGGADSLDDALEFSYCLPATKWDYFGARYVFGLFVMTVACISGVLFGLAGRELWLLWFDSGFDTVDYPWLLLPMRLNLVIAAYSLTYAIASIAPSRLVLLSVIPGTAVPSISVLARIHHENWAEPLMVFRLATIVMVIACAFYCTRETRGISWTKIALLSIGVIILALVAAGDALTLGSSIFGVFYFIFLTAMSPIGALLVVAAFMWGQRQSQTSELERAQLRWLQLGAGAIGCIGIAWLILAHGSAMISLDATGLGSIWSRRESSGIVVSQPPFVGDFRSKGGTLFDTFGLPGFLMLVFAGMVASAAPVGRGFLWIILSAGAVAMLAVLDLRSVEYSGEKLRELSLEQSQAWQKKLHKTYFWKRTASNYDQEHGPRGTIH